MPHRRRVHASARTVIRSSKPSGSPNHRATYSAPAASYAVGPLDDVVRGLRAVDPLAAHAHLDATLGHPPQPGHALRQRVRWHGQALPAVGQVCHPTQRGIGVAADDDPQGIAGLRHEDPGFEPETLALERSRPAAEEMAEQLQGFVGATGAIGEVGPDVGKFDRVPADADTEAEAAVRQPVDGGDLLGHNEGAA